jgi:polyhydroxyalkanoate synthesis regulator phasin
MAHVHIVKSARKDYPDSGIKKGETYYWWEFRYGGTHRSKTQPKPSQLTQSEFLSAAYGLNEQIEALIVADSMDALKSEVEPLVDEIRQLGEEQSDKLSNMPDSLQEGPTGELLQNRADACEEWASNLEGVDLDIDEPTQEDAENELDTPTLEEIKDEDLEEGQTKEQKLEELMKDYKQQLVEKEEELHEEYQQKVQEALDEIQGYTYEGE